MTSKNARIKASLFFFVMPWFCAMRSIKSAGRSFLLIMIAVCLWARCSF
jgi:hypothetical protein